MLLAAVTSTSLHCASMAEVWNVPRTIPIPTLSLYCRLRFRHLMAHSARRSIPAGRNGLPQVSNSQLRMFRSAGDALTTNYLHHYLLHNVIPLFTRLLTWQGLAGKWEAFGGQIALHKHISHHNTTEGQVGLQQLSWPHIINVCIFCKVSKYNGELIHDNMLQIC